VKKLHIRKNLGSYFGVDKRSYILPVICLFTGVILGTASSLVLENATAEPINEYLKNFFSAYSLQGVDKSEIFKISIHNNIKMLIILWVCGLSVFLIPFLALYIGVKGFKIGFAISFLIRSYSYSGAMLALSSMLPQMLIVVPFMIIYSAYCIRTVPKIRMFRERQLNNDSKKRLLSSNLSAVFLSAIVLSLASLMDCYIVPMISSSICMSLG